MKTFPWRPQNLQERYGARIYFPFPKGFWRTSHRQLSQQFTSSVLILSLWLCPILPTNEEGSIHDVTELFRPLLFKQAPIHQAAHLVTQNLFRLYLRSSYNPSNTQPFTLFSISARLFRNQKARNNGSIVHSDTSNQSCKRTACALGYAS
jgi:hypothetical protein